MMGRHQGRPADRIPGEYENTGGIQRSCIRCDRLKHDDDGPGWLLSAPLSGMSRQRRIYAPLGLRVRDCSLIEPASVSLLSIIDLSCGGGGLRLGVFATGFLIPWSGALSVSPGRWEAGCTVTYSPLRPHDAPLHSRSISLVPPQARHPVCGPFDHPEHGMEGCAIDRRRCRSPELRGERNSYIRKFPFQGTIPLFPLAPLNGEG